MTVIDPRKSVFNECGCFDEGVLLQVIPVIFDETLPCAPSRLELPEPFIFGLSPTKTEGPVSVIAAPFYRRPHDQVARPKMLQGSVRGAVFVDDLISEREIDVCGDGRSPERSRNDKPHTLG